MAYGNNRSGKQSRAHFRQAGGTVIKFRHPYFLGMIDTEDGKAIDEIDVSESVKLEGRFFEANQNQDSAKQVVLIDGSTVTVTNKMLNGTITVPAVPTSGDVAGGDFIAGCQLIQSVGDSVGGIITKTDFVNGKAQTKVYYGVTVKTCPTDVSEGNDVGVYNVQLLYAGWIQAEATDSKLGLKAIWAVGSDKGIEGFYSPYSLQKGATGDKPLTSDALTPEGRASDIADKTTGLADNSDEVEDAMADNGTWTAVLKPYQEVDKDAQPTTNTSTNPTSSTYYTNSSSTTGA